MLWIMRYFSFFFLLLFFTTTLYAEEVLHLFEAKIPLANTDKLAQQRATKEAFTQVLIKVTGNRTIYQHPSYPQLHSQAEKLVQQYRFENVPVAPSPATMENKPDSVSQEIPAIQHFLWIKFNALGVKHLLQQHKIATWSNLRPSTLLWLIKPTETGYELLTQQTTSPEQEHYLHALQQISYQRGIPVHLPFWDLQDQANIRLQNIWKGFEQTLQQASKRYQTQAILIGRVQTSSQTQWQVNWTLYFNGQSSYWQAQHHSQKMLINDAINQLADKFAAQFVHFYSGQAQHLLLAIHGIKQFQDYQKALQYLQKLPPIKKVYIRHVSAENAYFDISYQGTIKNVAQAVALGHLLTPINAAILTQDYQSDNDEKLVHVVAGECENCQKISVDKPDKEAKNTVILTPDLSYQFLQ